MKKYFKLITKLFMTLILLLTSFNVNNVFAGETSSALNAHITLHNYPETNPAGQTEFFSNVSIPAAASVTVSGTGAAIPNAWALIQFPKTDKTTKPSFGDSLKAKSYIFETADSYYVAYKYNNLSGANIGTFEFPFQFVESKVYNGYTLPITAKIYDATGLDIELTGQELLDALATRNVLASDTITYTAKKVEYSLNNSNVHAYNYSYIENNPAVMNGNTYVYNKTTTLDNTGNDTTVHMYVSPTVDFDGTNTPPAGVSTLSWTPVEKITMTIKVPEGVTITSGNWVYDAATQTYTSENINPANPHTSGWGNRYNYYGLTYGINFKFTDKNFDELFTMPVTFKVTENGVERSLPDRELKVKFNKVLPTPFTASGGISSHRDNLTGARNNTNINDMGAPIRFWLDEGKYTLVAGELSDKRESQQENGMVSVSYIANNNNTSGENKGIVSDVYTITDTLNLDSSYGKTYYKMFYIHTSSDAVREQLNRDGHKLYGITADGTKTLIKDNFKSLDKVEINDVNQKYDKLEIVFNEAIRLDRNSIYIYTHVLPTAAELEKFEDGTYTTRQYYNSSIEATHISAVEPSNNNEDLKTVKSNADSVAYNVSLFGIDPRPWISGDDNKSVRYSSTGTSFGYSTTVNFDDNYNSWGALSGEEINDVQIITLLPAGFSFEEVIGTAGVTVGTPTVVENYRSTGRTAVIYPASGFIPNSKKQAVINQKISIGSEVAAGNHQIDTFVSYPKNHILKPYYDSQIYKDEMDIDGDDNRSEIFMTRSSLIHYNLPLEFSMTKQVGVLTNELGFFATADIGNSFYYNLSIFNNTINSVNNLTIIDTLPYLNDSTMVNDDNGNYENRGSKYATPLTGALEDVPQNAEILKQFDIFYQMNLTSNVNDVKNGTWITKDEVTDWKNVTSFKLVLKPGREVAKGVKLNLLIPSIIPANVGVQPGEYAMNSAAVSLDGTNYYESNKVRVTFTTYKVSGIAFNDMNRDGIQNTGEEVVAGTKVRLIDMTTGQVAVNSTGQELTAEVGADGKYEIEVEKRGKYKVEFEKTNDQIFTETSHKDAFIDGNRTNNVETKDGNKGTSYEIELTPIRNTEVVNVSYNYDYRKVEIKKYTLNSDGEKEYLDGADFKLINKADGKEYTGTTTNGGLAVIQNIPFGEYTLVETKSPAGYDKEENEITVEVSHTGPTKAIEVKNEAVKRNVKLTKVDGDEEHKKLEGVKFGLYKGSETTPSYEGTTNQDGELTLTDVAYGTYTLKEIQTIAGYQLSTEETTVEVNENKPKEINLGNIKNYKDTGTISLTKVDKDDNNVKLAGVVFVLEKDGEEKYTATTNSDGKAEFTGVVLGEYKLKEKTTLPHYQLSTEEKTVTLTSSNNNINVGNIENELSKTSITVTKEWSDNDNQDGKRPDEITVKLLKDQVDTGQTITLNQANNWRGSFENQPATKPDGTANNYTVEEVVPTGYTATVEKQTDGSYKITNSYTPETITVTGTKTWDDADNQDGKRPTSIVVKVMNGSTEVQSQTVQGTGNEWTYTFTNLPKYEKGQIINYTIEEEDVAGYEKQINGNNITNSYTPETITVTGTKTWDDADNQDGKRPQTITVRLHADGVEKQVKQISTTENSWTFTDLPKYRDGGQEIIYTLTEDAVEHYTSKVENYNITNSYTPEKTTVTATKVWDDVDNQDGIRPEKVTIRLLVDGVDTGKSIELSANENWTGQFEDLDVYRKAGIKLTYTVTEDAVAEYETEITGNQEEGYKVINKHKPYEREIEVLKVWNDGQNKDKIRPSEIEVRLHADGQRIDEIKVTEKEGWKKVITNLPVNKAGKKIEYTIEEAPLKSYIPAIIETGEGKITIVNSYTPDEVVPTQPGGTTTDDPKGEVGTQDNKPKGKGRLANTGESGANTTILGLGVLALAGLVARRRLK